MAPDHLNAAGSEVSTGDSTEDRSAKQWILTTRVQSDSEAEVQALAHAIGLLGWSGVLDVKSTTVKECT